jgi:hypothetical protein
MYIENCIYDVALRTARQKALNQGTGDRMRSRRQPEAPGIQAINAVVETAQQLYERHIQSSGAPPMTMMARIDAEI